MRKKILIVLGAVLIAPLLIWFVAIPDSLIPGLLEKEASNMGLEMKINGFGKGLFLAFSADSLSISGNGGDIVVFRDIEGRVDPLGFLLASLRIPFRADLAGGNLEGNFCMGLKNQTLLAEVKGTKTEGIPALQKVARGLLSGKLSLINGSGNFTFRITDISGAPLEIKDANGLLELAGEEVRLKSVSLEGDNLTAKLKGVIRNGSYDLTAEVMPRGNGIPENEMLKFSLANYQSSPGYYVIPLKGELGSNTAPGPRL